jgi:hypothetical protein
MLSKIVLGTIDILQAVSLVFPDKPIHYFTGKTYYQIMKMIDATPDYNIFWHCYDLKHAKKTKFRL